MEKEWHLQHPDPEAVARLRRDLGCHPLTAALLVNRGMTSAESARRFMMPRLSHMREPFSIIDMQPAVDRIADALLAGERILVFGDYDVDGVTATALLTEFLSAAGGRVSFDIPHRTREGYGLKPLHVDRISAAKTATLVITADCGSSDHDAAEAAQAAGIDLVITDHHVISAPFPRAVAVVNPKRGDCPGGFEHLAGVGVAFCLLICLRKHLRDIGYWRNRQEPNLRQACDLVGLGTVADMVPLVGENRILTRVGLAVINEGGRPGIRALAGVSRIGDRPLDAGDIAFRLAPRINAAGRVDAAGPAVALLTTADAAKAEKIARDLDELNTRRQQLEMRILEEILAAVRETPDLAGTYSMVLAGPHWHEGVLGIVASRLVGIYHRPVVLAAVRDGIARGSARGIPGVDLYGMLSGCADLLEAFGGHAMAAGLTLASANIDALRQRFEMLAAAAIGPEKRRPELVIDSEILLDEVSDTLVDELEAMQPFGAANPEPVFMARHVKVLSSSPVGRNHRSMALCQSPENGGRRIRSIQFNVDPRCPPGDSLERIAFKIRWNRWNGRKTTQIVIAET